MLDQSVFTETIHEVAEIIRTSATPLSKEEILSYFKEMELNEQQENMVLEFLLTPHEEEEAEEETEEAEGGEQEAADWQETSDASVLAQNDPGKKEEKTQSRMFYRNLRYFRCIWKKSAVFRYIPGRSRKKCIRSF